MIKPLAVVLALVFSSVLAQAPDTERLAELDAYWAEISRCVKAGDFEGYKATATKDASLILGAQKKAYPLAKAFKQWKEGFVHTKSGEVEASVDFRFSERFGDETTAYETGTFLYQSKPTVEGADGKKPIAVYVDFEALLQKRDGEWKMIMEYQKAPTTEAAWKALKPMPPKTGLPMPGETLSVGGRQAFVIMPLAENVAEGKPVPWVWYAPTLPRLPGGHETWMFEKFLAKGIAIAGIDVGESFGSPAGRKGFSELHEVLTTERNFSPTPVLLARSRGGLMLYNWAVENPTKVAGVAGIYPVCNVASYPGIPNASRAYGMTPDELKAALPEQNPVERLKPLAEAGVPVLHLHGDNDKVVPLDANSAMLVERYKAFGGPAEVIVVKDGKHDGWPGWFQNERIAAFVIERALGDLGELSE